MKKPICPLLKKPCIEHECKFWTHITGIHPQSGAPLDTFDCSITWFPVLMIEQTRHMAGVQAAVESTRNEIVQRQDILNAAIEERQNETRRISGSGDGSEPRTSRLLNDGDYEPDGK